MKEFKDRELAKNIISAVLESAINNKDITLNELEKMSHNEICDYVIKFNNMCSNDAGDINITIIYQDEIIEEAHYLSAKKTYRLALILYATWIEHFFNSIIRRFLVDKNLTEQEQKDIIRLNVDAKVTWLLPLFCLPRLADKHRKIIKSIFDKRNEFVHYKWSACFGDEHDKKDKEYKKLCEQATKTITYLKTYETRNFVNRNKIKNILNKKEVVR